MEKFVVTGASGFMGEAVVRQLLAENCEVLGISASLPPEEVLAHPAYRHIASRLNCFDFPELAAEVVDPDDTYDYMIHLAWQGSMGPARNDPFQQNGNLEATMIAVDLARTLGCERFVGVGTVTELEAGEELLTAPAKHSPGFLYGLTKRVACEESRLWAEEQGLDHVWVRLGNIYHEEDNTPRFLRTMSEKLLRGETLSLSASTQVYDFVYRDDAVAALVAAARRGLPGETYYLGSGEPRALKDYLHFMWQTTGERGQLSFGAPVVGALPLEAYSVTPLARDTGWAPLVPFEDGYPRLVARLCKQLSLELPSKEKGLQL